MLEFPKHYQCHSHSGEFDSYLSVYLCYMGHQRGYLWLSLSLLPYNDRRRRCLFSYPDIILTCAEAYEYTSKSVFSAPTEPYHAMWWTESCFWGQRPSQPGKTLWWHLKWSLKSVTGNKAWYIHTAAAIR